MSCTGKAYLLLFIIHVFCLRDKCIEARDLKKKSFILLSSSGDITSSDSDSKVVDVTKIGAKGDGVTDDTKAFQAAWKAACGQKSTTLHIPPDYNFLVGPLTFSGPCNSNILFKVDGNVIATVNPKAWASKPLNWINFTKLNGVSIIGNGTFDGQGAAWWKISQLEYLEDSTENGNKLPSMRPTALRFYGSYDVSVQGITIQNSPQFHLKFDGCTFVTVVNVTISSPENSPNTDGIHVHNSEEVEIHHSSISCGDDCVSIQTGSSAIRVHDINCGPGHGISIGGLGKGATKACVSNVSVYDSNIHDALNGLRIKTWQGGSGQVKRVSFFNIEVTNVRVPINIDQFYCDKMKCTNKTSGIYISDITYEKIRGNYMKTPVYLACTDDVPCTDLKFLKIELEPVATEAKKPFCWNSYGDQQTGVECLQHGRPTHDPALTLSPEDRCY